jgi:RimJ/RimL family protein N-acetyltransferase
MTEFRGVDEMNCAGQKRSRFESLPTQIKDRRGRLILVRAYEAPDFEGLKEMYDTFEPKGLESGLPPPDDQARLTWLNYVVSDLFNVLAVYKGRVIGHSALDLSCAPSCPEYLIFIQKGFRNCGIGTTLSMVMKEVAKDAGCEKVVLTVRTANTRAVRVFKRVGFVFTDGIEVERDMELNLKQAKTSRTKVCRK